MADKGNTFLLLDDDKTFLDTLGRALERRGFIVIKAGTLQEALGMARENIPDYAVLDLKLHNESGLEGLEPLSRINPHIRMLILTGYSSIATAVSAIKKGAINYACKPLAVEEILAYLVEGKEQEVITEEEPISVDRLEWEHIQRVLEENDGNISATARSLGMHRRTLQRKLMKRPVKR